MAVVAALLPPSLLQRVRIAVRDRHEVVPCEDWQALTRMCERQPVRVAIIDLFLGEQANFEHLRILKTRLPRLAIVGYVIVTAERARDLFDAGRQGVDGLLVVDRDDTPMELLRIVALAESRALADVVRKQLRGVDSAVYDAVMLAISRAHERMSPAGLARQLGVPRRTLAQKLCVAGYPPPRRQLTWGRLIVAAHMMEDRHRSADRVSASMDFPSGSAFRNTCRRYLHATPGQIRARGGAQYVIRSLFRQVSAPLVPSSRPERSVRRLALAV